MEISVYEGYDLENLIQKAKHELGEDIKILYYETEDVKHWIPFRKKKRYKIFIEKEIEQFEKEDDRECISEKNNNHTDVDELISKIESILDQKLKTVVAPQAVHVKPPSEFDEKINSFDEFTGEAIDLIQFLISKEVEPDVAKVIVKEACGIDLETNKMDLSTSTFKEAIVKGVEKNIKFTGPFDVKKDNLKVITFVGPTGVGKTTNLFKIASEFVINRNLKVGAISTDTFKVGAVQQARAYANILNIPFHAITDSKNLRKKLLDMPELDVILIDTVGRSHYDYWRLGEIKEILSGGSDWMEVVLAISCNTKNREAMEIVNRYRTFFPINSLFFTKIDETRDPGILLNLPIKTGIPVSYVSVGQRVPEDIRILTPERIANYLLGE
jgi:flagellar biosynthesis protein FlhF